MSLISFRPNRTGQDGHGHVGALVSGQNMGGGGTRKEFRFSERRFVSRKREILTCSFFGVAEKLLLLRA